MLETKTQHTDQPSNKDIKTIKDEKFAFVSIDEDTRYAARNEVRNILQTNLTFGKKLEMADVNLAKFKNAAGLSFDEIVENIKYFYTKKPIKRRDKDVLGQFDVYASLIKMNYDNKWQKLDLKDVKDATPFWVLHSAAPNIGENDRPQDGWRYGMEKNKFDEKLYLDDMENIFSNLFIVMKHMQIKDSVWNPFGMGAFLRHLSKSFPADFADPPKKSAREKIKPLREKIANIFAQVAKKHQDINVHFGLPDGSKEKDAWRKEEMTDNLNAFLKAFKEIGGDNITIYLNGDVTTIAQKLANDNQKRNVGLINAANKFLIGNHWFNNRAFGAIDENLMRRSVSVALAAFIINQGIPYNVFMSTAMNKDKDEWVDRKRRNIKPPEQFLQGYNEKIEVKAMEEIQ
jgi:hypothetical protein